jgi:hypothetical protein
MDLFKVENNICKGESVSGRCSSTVHMNSSTGHEHDAQSTLTNPYNKDKLL